MTTTTPTATHLDESITVAGHAIHYMKKGTGAPLVMLHHSISSHGWLPLYDRLAKSFTVYAPDLPGFGTSQRPDWARSARDLGIMLQLMMHDLGLQGVTLVGAGFGGWIAAEMATMNQDRLARLVLIGAAGIQPREGDIVDQLVVDYVDYVKLGFHQEALFNQMFGEDPSRETRVLLYAGREMTMRVTWKPWMFDRALPMLLRGVQTPALVVWGAHDRIIPLDCGKQFAEALPNATLHVVEEGGHLLDFEAPESVAALIEVAAKAR